MRSFSKISTPPKPAPAMAESFSSKVPLSETVAIALCMSFLRSHCAVPVASGSGSVLRRDTPVCSSARTSRAIAYAELAAGSPA